MKENKDNTFEIKYLNENEKKKAQEYINKYNKKIRKENEFINKIIDALKYIFFTPLSIATELLSIILKFIGSVTAMGIPYGVYCLYKTIVLLKQNIPLNDIKQFNYALTFLLCPFISFAMSLMFEKLSNYFSYNK